MPTSSSENLRPNKNEAPDHGQRAVAEITALLRRHLLIEGLAREQVEETPLDESQKSLLESTTVQLSLAELRDQLNALHPADIALILETLPLNERVYLWSLVRADHEGEILIEVSDAVRGSLISTMDTEELVAAAETLPTDEIAALAPDLPQEVIDDVFEGLSVEEREDLRSAMSFDEDMVGALMDFEEVQVRSDVSLEVVLRYLRRFDELPTQTDQVFVVDRQEKLLGVLPINVLLVNDEDKLVGEVMQPPPVVLLQHEKADEAAAAFERYDLVSAPVTDTNGKLVGRVTVDEIL
ncbi:MAG: CBS domain-containing protein, partial [Burkholderiales bacterium]|nr:CBS domain-containing protein [Burkholderiales bacterium]